MQVLLQNPAVLLILVVVVARFVGRRLIAGKKNAAGAAPPRVEESDRTRRVREEVARKIAERRGEPPRQVISGPKADEDRRAMVPQRATTTGAPDADITRVLADQQRLVDQMRALEDAQAPRRVLAPAPPSGVVPVAEAHGSGLGELGDPRSARRAIVLREVLGAPRGLTLEGCLWR